MERLADTVISSANPISNAFREKEIRTFLQAAGFIKNLLYGRNNDKGDPLCVLKDNFGTCSTKHALLKRLADENNLMDVKLRLGIFRMNAQNTPEIEGTLQSYRLDYIPEAHNYLSVHGEVIDCTTGNSSKEDFINDLLVEIDIEPDQITDFKVCFHKEFLANWLQGHPDICYPLEELYRIREVCIECLADSKSHVLPSRNF